MPVAKLNLASRQVYSLCCDGGDRSSALEGRGGEEWRGVEEWRGDRELRGVCERYGGGERHGDGVRSGRSMRNDVCAQCSDGEMESVKGMEIVEMISSREEKAGGEVVER